MYYLYAAFFLSVMNMTSIKVLLPDIMAGLGVELNWLTWVVNAYTLPLAVFIPIAGKVGDLFGPRRFFFLGIFGLAAGSLLCGAAPSLLWLIAGRVGQALGAALLVPNALSLLLAGSKESGRGRVLGSWNSMGASGALFGPVTSGLLVGALSWRGSFLFIAGLSAVIALAAGKYLPAEKPTGSQLREEKRPFDLAGASLLMSSIFLLLMGATLLPDWGWKNPWILLFPALFLLLLALFYQVEGQTADPVLNLSLLNRPPFSLGLAVTFMEQFVMAGTLFVMPIFFSSVQGHNAASTALLLAPAAAAAVLFSPVGGQASDRFGPGPPVTAGMILRGLSFALLSLITVNSSYLYIAAALALNGAGFGIATVPALNAIIGSSGGNRHGAVSGMHNMIRFTGASVGTSVCGILLYALMPASPLGLTGAIPGFREVFLMAVAVCGLGAAVGAYLWVEEGIREKGMNNTNSTADAPASGPEKQ